MQDDFVYLRGFVVPLKGIGVLLPTRETAMLGSYDFGPLLDIARQVEDHGFDSVWVGDSFVARPRLEPLTLLSSVATATSRITVGTAALIASTREPVNLAHSLVTLDHAASGRLQLAIGTGSPLPVKSEDDAVPMSYNERAGRVDEAVTAWKQVWSGDDGELKSNYWDLRGLREQPPPAQAGGPQMWLASGNTPKAVARAGRYYDGWMPLVPDPADYETGWAAICKAAEEAGRAPDAMTPSMFVTINLTSDADRARAELEDYTQRYYRLPLGTMSRIMPFFGGSPEDCVRWLGEYVRAGARHFVLRMGSFENGAEHLRLTAEHVLPALRALQID
ncbi:LLM class flavin-dependent oxidoreductase [Actinosynnema sp. NPDC023794]